MDLKTKSLQLLKHAYGSQATFREGQFEAIEATLQHKRTLVVQKTGWGKSLIYFISAKLLRQDGKGMTFVVSPLLELMNNQIEAAKKFNLKCSVLNSTIKDTAERAKILDDLKNGCIDIFFTTPETLFGGELQEIITDLAIDLFVIDEAHCLSDWGHDFRREYSRLYKIIAIFPDTTSVLCTTATANDRVIEDLKEHLGSDLFVSRGDLMRESLHLSLVDLSAKGEKYAWLLDHLNDLPGTGIIYCLTRRDCENLHAFLSNNGIATASYYSAESREKENSEAINKFKHNEIKAIIATIKLGMGYDKPDIGFVINFQRPQNIVSYYQQIGRAGRSIPSAYAILMSSDDDTRILNHFIDNAFPREDVCENILMNIDGKSKAEISHLLNYRGKIIQNALDFLEFDGYLRKDGSRFYRVPTKIFEYDRNKYNAITNMRRQEMQQMYDITKTDKCLLRYTVDCLNNIASRDCGKCSNCLGKPLIPVTYTKTSLEKAQIFLKNQFLIIEPRKLWPDSKKIEHLLTPGICLCKYGDSGYGTMVQEDKYRNNDFREELIIKSVEVLADLIKNRNIDLITCVPSLRSDKVKTFTKKLSKMLGVQFVELVQKTDAPQQKNMENSAFQCRNARNSFSIPEETSIDGNNILLIDDMVDSRWTITVCGDLLMRHGANSVTPFCLADTSEGN